MTAEQLTPLFLAGLVVMVAIWSLASPDPGLLKVACASGAIIGIMASR